MFELSVALKYLLPRWRQLSVSIISLISILVITLVVWLILVFFSVTDGLEKIWVSKMVTLTAPVRVSPTPEYYNSYYYQIDSISANSEYATKSIFEKLHADASDPYDPEIDEEIPKEIAVADRHADGKLKDLVKLAYQTIDTLPETTANDFEVTFTNLKLRLSQGTSATISQSMYLGSVDPHNHALQKIILPPANVDLDKLGEGILLPKSYKESGVVIGDKGYLGYFTPTTSTVQEQRQPIHVAGFYDPGMISMGGKVILASHELTSTIRAAQSVEESSLTNGINVRFEPLTQAEGVKSQLQEAFDKLGISKYWKIETYKEFEFTKDIIQQLGSEKNIFSLIALVIIIVACSNIISMLVILVNDKRVEIGILRAMGATSTSIATIFGICGFVMGFIGSLVGTGLAYVTLKNIHGLIDLISRYQGYKAFNPMFFGDTLPTELSAEALIFVLSTTAIISLVAGVIPAVKASMLQPSKILRSE